MQPDTDTAQDTAADAAAEGIEERAAEKSDGAQLMNDPGEPKQSPPTQEAMDGSPCEVELRVSETEYPPSRHVDDWGFIKFQCGPIGEVGENGTTIEAVLGVLVERLRGFQNGPYACDENQGAITSLNQALSFLNARTAKRQAQGVEGTNAPHS